MRFQVYGEDGTLLMSVEQDKIQVKLDRQDEIFDQLLRVSREGAPGTVRIYDSKGQLVYDVLDGQYVHFHPSDMVEAIV